MNDTTVWCQSRGVTEPAGETDSRYSLQSAVPTAKHRCLYCRIFLFSPDGIASYKSLLRQAVPTANRRCPYCLFHGTIMEYFSIFY
ncbi:MAG: hypothetical protein IKA44_05695 [Clostridia bacterium]|nr:hypothetical protein [Clostridia bacterium]